MYRINNYTSFLIYQRLYYKFSPAKEYNQISAEFGHWEILMVGSSLSFHRTFGKQVFTDWDQAKCSNDIFFLSFYHYTKIVIWIYVLQKKLTDTIFEVKKRQTDKRCRVSNSEVVLWTVAQNAFLFVLKTRKLRIYKVDLKSTLVKEEVFFYQKVLCNIFLLLT